MNRSQVVNKMKGQIREFSGKLCRGLPKVVRRFVEEIVYGILCSQCVRVAEIARTVNEPIPEIKTVNRLCRQLGREGLEKRLTRNLVKEGAFHIGGDTLLLMDTSDVTKKYAKKMEYLERVKLIPL